MLMHMSRYASADGKKFGAHIADVSQPVAEGWVVTKHWFVQSTTEDPEGWKYGVDFFSLDWFSVPNAEGSGFIGSKLIFNIYYSKYCKKITLLFMLN